MLADLKNHLASIPGIRLQKRYIVFESDDWGCLRMPSVEVYDYLARKGLLIDSAYNRYDSIENAVDLEALKGVLIDFRDTTGQHPVFTLNFNTANPDYAKIEATGFAGYHGEDFLTTYQRVHGSLAAWEGFLQGQEKKVFAAQFHGKEHLQVETWMDDLRTGDERAREGFNQKFFGFHNLYKEKKGYLTAFAVDRPQDLPRVGARIVDGLNDFQRIFGFSSRSVIAPQNTLHEDLLPIMFQEGVDIIQGARRQKYTSYGKDPQTRKRFTGKYNNYGQLDLARNATFEPSESTLKIDWVNKCLKEINQAFLWRKPAIICTHRMNYLGGLNEENRINGLQQLRLLLGKIVERWPDVQFTDTVTLAEIINSKKV